MIGRACPLAKANRRSSITSIAFLEGSGSPSSAAIRDSRASHPVFPAPARRDFPGTWYWPLHLISRVFDNLTIDLDTGCYGQLAMAPKATTARWFVSLEKAGSKGKRRFARQSNTFEDESHAKVFARLKVEQGFLVTAGTINPVLPRRLIPSDSILLWLNEGSDSDWDSHKG